MQEGLILCVLGLLAGCFIALTMSPPPDDTDFAKFDTYHRHMKQFRALASWEFPFFVYYINMDQSTERRAHMEEQLQHLQCPHRRVAGHPGRAPHPRGTVQAPHSTDGEVGCTVSHVLAVRAAGDAGLERVLICEDDACFGLTVNVRWKTLFDNLDRFDPEWEVLSLYDHESDFRTPELYFRRWPELHCTAAYVLHRRGMVRLLDSVRDPDDPHRWLLDEARHGRVVADYLLPRCLRGHAHVVSRSLVYAHWDTSTIHTDHDHASKAHNAGLVNREWPRVFRAWQNKSGPQQKTNTA